MLVIIENGSFGNGPERMFYVMGALGVGYGYVARAMLVSRQAPGNPARATG